MLSDRYDARLDPMAVAARYSDPAAYSRTDAWHRHTARTIRREIERFVREHSAQRGNLILNAGAGNNDFGILPANTINLDLCESGVCSLPNPLIANVEEIPLPSGMFDMIICVGSVLNYCDAPAAISEFSRLLKSDAQLILEFESARSAEFIGTQTFSQPVAVAETFYQNAVEVVRVYQPGFIRQTLAEAELVVTKVIPIHLVSPWVLWLTRNVSIAAAAAYADGLLRAIPSLDRWSANQIVICQRRARKDQTTFCLGSKIPRI